MGGWVRGGREGYCVLFGEYSELVEMWEWHGVVAT